jgi:4-hydroxybenzoate polyprenyltransferase
MGIIKKRRPVDLLFGFFLLSHPGPVLLHMIAVSVFALSAVWPHISWSIFTLVIMAHLAMQLSIAFLNDYCDRQRDVLSKKYKPIVHGLVRPQEALIAGILLMIIMLFLLLPLNPLAILTSLLYLACMQGYNLGLKVTPLSGIVFALAIPLIPVYAFVGMGHFVPFLLWVVPVGALIGVAFNLANALPDFEEDAASHARTLAIVLGVQGAFIACNLLILLAATLIAILAITNLVSAQPWILLATLLFAYIATIYLFILFKPQKSKQVPKIYFYLVVFICLVLAGGWLVSLLV